MKHALPGCFLLLLFSLRMPEAKNVNFFSFEDIYGNSFKIEYNPETSFKPDSAFFRANLTGVYFNETLEENPLRFSYLISGIKEIKGENRIEFTCVKAPKTKDVTETLKYQGRGRYSMILTKDRREQKIERIDLLYNEI